MARQKERKLDRVGHKRQRAAAIRELTLRNVATDLMVEENPELLRSLLSDFAREFRIIVYCIDEPWLVPDAALTAWHIANARVG